MEKANNDERIIFLTMPGIMRSQDRGIGHCLNQDCHNNNAMKGSRLYYKNAFASISFPLKKIAQGF
jgi:hypothetical protein